MTTHDRVLLLELNEINWGVIDRLIATRGRGFLPNFTRLREQGAWAVQSAVEKPPHLDPWVTWVTLHTGVTPAEHGANVLEQAADTIAAKRTWQYAAEAGRSVGVFGSISAYPPSPVSGFMVPGPFAPSDDTYPESLRPVQAVNRRYTQVHARQSEPLGLWQSLRMGVDLVRLGLRPSTCVRVATQLVGERIRPHTRWRRVSLQPMLNFDIFSSLYRRERPDFATWHSNHAAHYMHHYWRAWDDAQFTVKSTADERERYGEAVPHGYRICDELMGRAMTLIDEDTVLVVASSMGQQPYRSDTYDEGKIIVRIRSIDALLDAVGREGITDVVPTMVPQWNLTVPDAQRRAALKACFEGILRRVADRKEAGFSVLEVGTILTITPLGLSHRHAGIEYLVPGPQGMRRFPIDALLAVDAPTVKQGMHHADGVLAFYGHRIARGRKLPNCTNLDVAPTLLSLLGLSRPATMTGRVLEVAAA